MKNYSRRHHRVWPGGTIMKQLQQQRVSYCCAVLLLLLLLVLQPSQAQQQTDTVVDAPRALRRQHSGASSTVVGNKGPAADHCLTMGQNCGGLGFTTLSGAATECCDGYVCMAEDAFSSACVLSTSVHKDLGSSMPQTTLVTKPLPPGETVNLNQALYLSLLFYEAQRSGSLPATHRVPWRGDSFVDDKGRKGEDLSGGYFDGSNGGSLIKFGLPAAWTTTMLAWGFLEYPDAYEAAGETTNLVAALRWSLDFFLKAHTAPDELYVQVGDQMDLAYWSPPEMSLPAGRPAYKVTCRNPGSEPAAETAAAMAAGYLVFQDRDPAYAQKLLSHAKQLHDFADRCRGNYVFDGAVGEASPFYQSLTGYEDELAWSALFLFRATGDTTYLKQAKDLYPTCCSPQSRTYGGGLPPVAIKAKVGTGSIDNSSTTTPSFVGDTVAFSWDDKAPGVSLLLYTMTAEPKYANDTTAFLDMWLAKPRTPQGLAYLSSAPPVPAAASASFLALLAADRGLNSKSYRAFARHQVYYMLGHAQEEGEKEKASAKLQGDGRSFLIGYGSNYPKAPAHRASSCEFQRTNSSCSCSAQPNAFRLYGGLVGGPRQDDSWEDACDDFEGNQVSLANNAGFTSAVAGLKHLEQQKEKKP